MALEHITSLVTWVAIRDSVIKRDLQWILEEYERELNEPLFGDIILSVKPTSINVEPGKSVKYVVTTVDANYKVASKDTKIATVDRAKSEVTGVAVGSTILEFTATYQDDAGKDLTTTVNVPITVAKEAQTINVTPTSVDLSPGNPVDLNINVTGGTAQGYNMKLVGLEDKLTATFKDFKDKSAKVSIGLKNPDEGDLNGEFSIASGGGSVVSNKVKVTRKVQAPQPSKIKTIKFNANGGSGTMNDVQVDLTNGNVNYKIPASTFTPPANKRFKDWTGSDGKTYTVDQIVSMGTTNELTLTANYEDIQTKKVKIVKFNANGGTGTMNDVEVDLSVNNGKFTVPASTFTAPAGKQFKTWSEAADNENKVHAVNSEIDFGSEGTFTLFAIWETVNTTPTKPATPTIQGNPKTLTLNVNQGAAFTVTNKGNYNITFESNDTAVTTTLTNNNQVRVVGKSIQTKTTFDLKIYLDNQGVKSDAYTCSVTVNADPALTPKIKKVKFNANGGTGTMAEEEVNITNGNVNYVIPESTFTAPNGQRFKNWLGSDNNNYNPGQTISFGTTADFTLTAQWEAIPAKPPVPRIDANPSNIIVGPKTGGLFIVLNRENYTVEYEADENLVTATKETEHSVRITGKSTKNGGTFTLRIYLVNNGVKSDPYEKVINVAADPNFKEPQLHPTTKRTQTITFGADISSGTFANMFKVGGHISQNAAEGLVYGKITGIEKNTATLELLSPAPTKFSATKVNNTIPKLAVTTGASAGVITAKNGDDLTVELTDTSKLFNTTDNIAVSGLVFNPNNVKPSKVSALQDKSQVVTISGAGSNNAYAVGGFLHQGNPNVFTNDKYGDIKELPLTDEIDPQKYIVIAVAGQSNSVGYDESTWDASFEDVSGRIKQLGYYGNDNLQVIPLKPCAQNIQNMSNIPDDTNKLTPQSLGVTKKGTKGIHLPLGQNLINQIPADYDILIVPVAFGMTGWKNGNLWLKDGVYSASKMSLQGSGVNHNWTPEGALFQTLRDRVIYALNRNPENKFAGVVWCQGETENNSQLGANINGFNEMTTKLNEAWNTAKLENGTNNTNNTVVSRTKRGKVDMSLWFIHETTGYWRNQPRISTDPKAPATGTIGVDARKVWENYRKVIPAENYVQIPIDLSITNLVNGDASTSSARASHFGNNAFRDVVAPKVAQAMIAADTIHGVDKTVKIQMPNGNKYDDRIIKYSTGASDLALLDNGQIKYLNQYPATYSPLGGSAFIFKKDVNQVSIKNIAIHQLVIILESVPGNGYWAGLYFQAPLMEPTIICGKSAGKTLFDGLYDKVDGLLPNSVSNINPMDYTKGTLTISRDAKVSSKYNFLIDNKPWFNINIADSTDSLEGIGYHSVVEHTIGLFYGWSGTHTSKVDFATVTDIS